MTAVHLHGHTSPPPHDPVTPWGIAVALGQYAVMAVRSLLRR